jgi:membrane-bound lytic murein transglycosylase B
MKNIINKNHYLVMVVFLSLFFLGVTTLHAADKELPPFSEWLSELRVEAAQKGISKITIDSALKNAALNKRVIELDLHQPEFTQTLWTYLKKRISTRIIIRGKMLLVKHQDLLARVAEKHKVQPRFLVAFWALETHFGDYTGSFPLINSLVTLAYDKRRGEYFRKQLFATLTIMDKGDIKYDVKASWAGAMGQCQFMPDTYSKYAIDFDGDSKRDLWGSLPDVFGSAANYLSKSGWDDTKTWGREVKLPEKFNLELTGLDTIKDIKQWQKLGVRQTDGKNLPRVDIAGSIILPVGFKGPAFLVYKNFRTIMIWNRSILYAIAVGHLADRIDGKPELSVKMPKNEVRLAKSDIIAIQTGLNTLGFKLGKPDGIVGPLTRAAVKTFQKKSQLPADGYPTFGLLERIRQSLKK